MGLCQSFMDSEEYRQQQKLSRNIDKELDKRPKYLLQRILLLGPAHSGKSTCLKQMHLMHAKVFTQSEIAEKKFVIYSNIAHGMQKMLDFLKTERISLKAELLQDYQTFSTFFDMQGRNVISLDPIVVKSIKVLWRSDQIQSAFSQRAKYNLTDSIEYFLENIDRLAENDFQPNNLDILHTRMPTTGVQQAQFEVRGMTFEVYDVGGQKSERKKWMHCFDNMNALLFVTAVNEFDYVTTEDTHLNKNHVEEALTLFNEVSNNVFFKLATLILFLNKIDLLERKIQTVNLKDSFKDFKGENNSKDVIHFFRKKFERCLVSRRNRKLFIHETCAISNTVQIIINSVIDTILQENLKETGML